MKKYMINLIVLTGGLAFATIFASAQYMRQQEPVLEQQQVQYTCPMHPEVMSNKPGKCPICGMALVKGTDDQKGIMMNRMDDSTGMMHGHGMNVMGDSTHIMYDHMMSDSVMAK